VSGAAVWGGPVGLVGRHAQNYPPEVLPSRKSATIGFNDMNEFLERRFSRRVEVDLPCRVEQGGRSLDGRIIDLSLAGARVSAPEVALDPRERLTIEILPGTSKAFSIAAAVVRLEPPDSVSLRFRGDVAAIGSRVAALLRRSGRSRAAGPSA
jgi:hypothetical protein